MAEWTHRVCERCWFDTPLSAHPDNPDGFRLPVQVKEIEPGVCCYCGGLCVSGIFTRADEKTLACQGRHEPDELGQWAKVSLA